MDNEKVANKTGDWYFGVVVLNNPDHPSVLSGSCSGLSKSDLSDSFGFKSYDLRIFTGGEGGSQLFSFLSSCYSPRYSQVVIISTPPPRSGMAAVSR